ncbi:hypothetical protein [Clostridium tertium]|uniref:hypothetical protein n=1 Tax=Clostridium tertium TaxID=1559 RepID=UPI0024B33882|nr:hypothetical protein [Clostridium tertium]MDI9218136.1 hypothetical protein [Clostridium tertium]
MKNKKEGEVLIDKLEKKLKFLIKNKGKKLDKSKENYQYKNRNYKSKKYNIATIIIVLGYLFFFTSNSIFNSEGDIMSTPFDKEIALPNYKIKMKNSMYSNENKILEVNFSIEKTNVIYSGELKVEGKERKNPGKKLDVKMINLNGKDYSIIVKLPKEWTTVLLEFRDESEAENKVKFYVDRRESVEDEALKEKTRKEYLLQTVYEELENVNKNILENKNQIEEKNKEITQLDSEINRLEVEKKYLTDSELIEMNSKIESLYSQKLDIEKSVLQLKESIEELNGKIEKLELKKEDYNQISD